MIELPVAHTTEPYRSPYPPVAEDGSFPYGMFDAAYATQPLPQAHVHNLQQHYPHTPPYYYPPPYTESPTARFGGPRYTTHAIPQPEPSDTTLKKEEEPANDVGAKSQKSGGLKHEKVKKEGGVVSGRVSKVAVKKEPTNIKSEGF